jgi:hypothetical protein
MLATAEDCSFYRKLNYTPKFIRILLTSLEKLAPEIYLSQVPKLILNGKISSFPNREKKILNGY